MKQMVVFVLNNPDHCTALLDAWEDVGAPGITILESTGLVRLRQAATREDLPLMPSLFDLMRGKETHHRTIFSVVEDEAQAQALIETTAKVFAAMDESDLESSGVLFVLPVTELHQFATHKAAEKAARNR